MSIVITVVIALAVCLIYGAIHKGWVKSELQTLHNRINSANSEVHMFVSEVKGKTQNAQAIASNALSSAQRAEAKFIKHIEETVGKEKEVASA